VSGDQVGEYWATPPSATVSSRPWAALTWLDGASSRERRLLAALGALTLFYALSTFLWPRPELGQHMLLDGWVNGIIPAGGLAVAAAAALRRRPRWPYLLIVAAGATFVVGDVIWALRFDKLAEPPFPSLADGFYLAFYVPAFVGVAAIIGSRLSWNRATFGVDTLLAALATSAAIAAVFVPAIASSGDNGGMGKVVVVAYPIADVTIQFLLLTAVVSLGRSMGRDLAWIAAGVGIFAVGDLLYLFLQAERAYEEGTPLDVTWILGILVMSVGLTVDRPEVAVATKRPTVYTSTIAMMLAALVLLVGQMVSIGRIATVCALATMVIGTLRTAQAFRAERRSADAVREARTDPLTDLPNRRALFDNARRALEHRSVELMMIDLNGFKEINDSFGHDAGDELLKLVAAAWRHGMPQSALLARLGGDEFAVLVTAAHPSERHASAASIADLLHDPLSTPFVVHGRPFHVSASVGIARAPLNGDLTDLFRRADAAMYRAKRNRSGTAYFDSDAREVEPARLVSSGQLRAGLDHGELVLHYQPQVVVGSLAPCGAEALVRWQHPIEGLLMPSSFLPVADRAHLMAALTKKVIQLSAAQVAEWKHAGLEVSVAINAPASVLCDGQLYAELTAAVTDYSVPPRLLRVEITEDVLSSDPIRAATNLARLSRAGCAIALDDFGVGHSSLGRLADLHVDEVKLDRSLIAGIDREPRRQAIVEGLAVTARRLGLRLVAEGVETEAEMEMLGLLGIDAVQGFLVALPMAGADLPVWWAQQQALAPP
jgi:diguanylate cyclase